MGILGTLSEAWDDAKEFTSLTAGGYTHYAKQDLAAVGKTASSTAASTYHAVTPDFVEDGLSNTYNLVSDIKEKGVGAVAKEKLLEYTIGPENAGRLAAGIEMMTQLAEDFMKDPYTTGMNLLKSIADFFVDLFQGEGFQNAINNFSNNIQQNHEQVLQQQATTPSLSTGPAGP